MVEKGTNRQNWNPKYQNDKSNCLTHRMSANRGASVQYIKYTTGK